MAPSRVSFFMLKIAAAACSPWLINTKQCRATDELHIASGQWHTILEVAEIIADLFPDTKIQPATAKDEVQKDAHIDPDPFIRNYWQPKIGLREGITRVAREMNLLG